jgi:hypothetical protein
MRPLSCAKLAIVSVLEFICWKWKPYTVYSKKFWNYNAHFPWTTKLFCLDVAFVVLWNGSDPRSCLQSLQKQVIDSHQTELKVKWIQNGDTSSAVLEGQKVNGTSVDVRVYVSRDEWGSNALGTRPPELIYPWLNWSASQGIWQSARLMAQSIAPIARG